MNDGLKNIIKLEKSYIKPASQMLARAFYNDPIVSHAYSDAAEKNKRLPYMYEFLLLYGLRYGTAHTTSSQTEGVSLWLPSDRVSMPFRRLLLSRAILPALKMGNEAGRRMQNFSKYVENKHRELAPYNHWYLMILGVEPKFQGRGYASKLIKGMLTKIDEEGLPCYLETEKEENVALYQHFDFEVIEEFIVPDTTVNLWVMLRESKLLKHS